MSPEIIELMDRQRRAICGGTITEIESYRHIDGSLVFSCEIERDGKPYRIFDKHDGSEFATAEQFRRFKLSQYPLSECVQE